MKDARALMRVGFALAAIALLFVAMAVVWNYLDKHHEGEAADDPGSRCDGREGERREWMVRPNPLRPGMESPSTLNYHGSGECFEKIESIEMTCPPPAPQDSPYLGEALALGFTTFVCVHMGDEVRSEYKLSDVYVDDITKPDPPKPAAKPRKKPKIVDELDKLEKRVDAAVTRVTEAKTDAEREKATADLKRIEDAYAALKARVDAGER